MASRYHWLIAFDLLLVALLLVGLIDAQHTTGNHWRFFGSATEQFISHSATHIIILITAVNIITTAAFIKQNRYAMAAALCATTTLIVFLSHIFLRLALD